MVNELKVLGAGLGRTGTSSLRAALELLGYNPAHMVTLFANTELRYAFSEAITNLNYSVDAIYEQNFVENEELTATMDQIQNYLISIGIDGALDHPWSDFLPLLLKRNPDAKIILGTRDDEAWANSYRVIEEMLIEQDRFPMSISPMFSGFLPLHYYFFKAFANPKGMTFEAFDYSMYSKFSMEEKHINLIKYKQKFEARFRNFVEENQLQSRTLEFRPQDGWEPLCKFLEKEDLCETLKKEGIEYPRANDKAAMQKGAATFRFINDYYGLFFGLVAMILFLLVKKCINATKSTKKMKKT